jgi:hypothetical protein
MMRGGTSRAPYFLASDLPEDREEIAKILEKVMGSGHELKIEGIAGGNSLTSKSPLSDHHPNRVSMLIICLHKSASLRKKSTSRLTAEISFPVSVHFHWKKV